MPLLEWHDRLLSVACASLQVLQLVDGSTQTVPYLMVSWLSSSLNKGLAKPSMTRPSAWRAHRNIREVIIFLWGLVVISAGWGVDGPGLSRTLGPGTVASFPTTFRWPKRCGRLSLMRRPLLIHSHTSTRKPGLFLRWFQFCIS